MAELHEYTKTYPRFAGAHLTFGFENGYAGAEFIPATMATITCRRRKGRAILRNMSTEVTYISIRPGTEEEFLRVFGEKVAGMFREAGATDITLYRSQENPTKLVKTSVWKSRQARLHDFVETPLYQEFRGLMAPFLDGPPSLDDYDTVFVG